MNNNSTRHKISLSYKIIAITFAGLLVVFSVIAAASWFNAKLLFHQSKTSITQLFTEELAKSEKTIRETLERKGNSLAGFLADISGLEIISFDHEALKTFLENIVKDQDVLYALYMIDMDNSRIGKHRPLEDTIWKYDHQDGEVIDSLRQKIIAEGAVIEFSKDITYSGEKVGTIIVGISQESLIQLRHRSMEQSATIQNSLYDEIRSFLQKLNIYLLAIYGLAFIILGGFLFISIKHLILKRIYLLSAIFQQVAKGDLNKKIDILSSDEIGDLCSSFNEMTNSLKQVTVSRDNLEESNKKLQLAQKQLAESHRVLEASHEFSQHLIEQSPVGIVIVEDLNKIADINAAGAKILHRTKEQIVGLQFNDFFLSGTQDYSFQSMDKSMMIQAEHTCRGNAGQLIPILMNFIELKNEENNNIVLCTFVDISSQKDAEEKLRKISITDELTGLLNRRGFIEMAAGQLKLANRSRNDLYLLFADLDNMKWINDTLGHQAGDQALLDAADILRETFRQSDILGRLGGDEFAALLPVDTGREDEETVTKRLRDNLKTLNSIKPRSFSLEISTGIARYEHCNPISLEDLMSKADDLMYACKMDRKKKNG